MPEGGLARTPLAGAALLAVGQEVAAEAVGDEVAEPRPSWRTKPACGRRPAGEQVEHRAQRARGGELDRAAQAALTSAA